MSSVLLDEWHAHIQACCAVSEEKYCREIAAIEWMAAHFGFAVSRTNSDHMCIGNAELAFRSLHVLLGELPLEEQFAVVAARVKHAIAIQALDGTAPLLESVFPRLRPPPDAQELVWFEPIANGRLLECLVSDEPSTVRYLDPVRIIGFGLGVQGLRDQACTNLRGLKAVFEPNSEEPRIQMCRMGDGHDAARLLVASDLLPQVSRVLCCVPDRDTLLCVDPAQSDIQSLALKMRKMAMETAVQSAYPLSAECFLVDGETVQHVPFRTDSLGAKVCDL